MISCGNKKKSSAGSGNGKTSRFDTMISNCYQYASEAHQGGRPIVGIMCEYTPRELIMAVGAVPVCLCGGALETIAPAEKDLPSGLCPLIKSTYGYYCTQSNPFLQMADLVAAETTCDGKKKMYELMGRQQEMYVLELPQKPDDPQAMEHWRQEVRQFKQFLEARYKKEINDDSLRRAIQTMNQERALRRGLAEMNRQCPPVWSGQQLLKFKSIISGIADDFAEYERLIELGSRARDAGGGSPAKVRVLLTGVPTVHGAEKVVEIIENAGGAVVCMENCTGLKPILEDVDVNAGDPLTAIAEKYFHLPCSVMTANHRRIESLKKLAGEYRPDCIIDFIWQGCLTYDVESYLVKESAEALSMPYLKIVTDYSPSDSARIALRVEALIETAKSRH